MPSQVPHGGSFCVRSRSHKRFCVRSIGFCCTKTPKQEGGPSRRPPTRSPPARGGCAYAPPCLIRVIRQNPGNDPGVKIPPNSPQRRNCALTRGGQNATKRHKNAQLDRQAVWAIDYGYSVRGADSQGSRRRGEGRTEGELLHGRDLALRR